MVGLDQRRSLARFAAGELQPGAMGPAGLSNPGRALRSNAMAESARGCGRMRMVASSPTSGAVPPPDIEARAGPPRVAGLDLAPTLPRGGIPVKALSRGSGIRFDRVRPGLPSAALR